MKYSKNWSKLDNAAKLYPPTVSRYDSRVFRFICELYDDIDPAFLESALIRTIEKFPMYRSVIKRGLFWHYLEESALPITVSEETLPPCYPLYLGDSRSLLFRVTYYKKRINFEVFHALSDGTGALNFLRLLVYYYITERYAPMLSDKPPQIDYDASEVQQRTNSFEKYYTGDPVPKEKRPAAYQIRGDRFDENQINVISGTVSTRAIIDLSHRYDVTVTEFLTAALLVSINEGMSRSEERRPVVITVPVNLRRFFPSESARNFFSVINLAYNFSKNERSFEAVLEYVHDFFKSQISEETLLNRINKFFTLEKTTKAIPLFIKNPSIKIGNLVDSKKTSATLSNIGRVEMPREISPFIRLFSVFTNTSKVQVCLCSFEDNTSISFTSPFVSTDIQRCFFRILTGMDVRVELTSNQPENDKKLQA